MDFELTPVLGVCVGVVCGLLVVALGVVLALKFRTENRHSPALKVTKTEYRVDMDEPEEKNPDIIPSSKGERNKELARNCLRYDKHLIDKFCLENTKES